MGDVVMSLVFVMFGEKRRAFVRDKESERDKREKSRLLESGSLHQTSHGTEDNAKSSG